MSTRRELVKDWEIRLRRQPGFQDSLEVEGHEPDVGRALVVNRLLFRPSVEERNDEAVEWALRKLLAIHEELDTEAPALREHFVDNTAEVAMDLPWREGWAFSGEELWGRLRVVAGEKPSYAETRGLGRAALRGLDRAYVRGSEAHGSCSNEGCRGAAVHVLRSGLFVDLNDGWGAQEAIAEWQPRCPEHWLETIRNASRGWDEREGSRIVEDVVRPGAVEQVVCLAGANFEASLRPFAELECNQLLEERAAPLVIAEALSGLELDPGSQKQVVQTWRNELVAGNLARKLPLGRLELRQSEIVSWTEASLTPAQAGPTAERWVRREVLRRDLGRGEKPAESMLRGRARGQERELE